MTSDPRIIVHPLYAWGYPMTARRGISTAVIWSRTLAGESAADLAEDYGLAVDEVEAALEFERWCRRRGRYNAPSPARLARRERRHGARPGAGGWPRQVWPRSER